MIRRLLLLLALCLACWPLAASELSPVDLLSEGRVDDALKILHSRVQSAPDDAEAFHLLCRSYFAEQRWDQAVAACERSVALNPDSSDYHMWMGRAYGEKAGSSNFITAAGLTKKVRAEFEKAVELNSGNVLARTDLAEFYLEAPGFMGGGKDKALRQAQELARSDEARAHWVEASIAAKEKNNSRAEEEYKAAIQASHGQASYWLNLASFYRGTGRLNEMESAINSAIDANRKKPNVFFDAAQLLLRAGRDFPAAIQMVTKYLTQEKPVEEAPAFQAHYLLGVLYEKQGNTEAAVKEYRAALSLARDYSRAQEALKRLDPSALR